MRNNKYLGTAGNLLTGENTGIDWEIEHADDCSGFYMKYGSKYVSVTASTDSVDYDYGDAHGVGMKVFLDRETTLSQYGQSKSKFTAEHLRILV